MSNEFLDYEEITGIEWDRILSEPTVYEKFCDLVNNDESLPKEVKEELMDLTVEQIDAFMEQRIKIEAGKDIPTPEEISALRDEVFFN